MGKYGEGLGKEFALAVLRGEVSEVFTTKDLSKFVESRGWNPPENYLNVLLANSSSENHSKTYVKYFKSIGTGKYMLSKNINNLL